MKFLYSDTQDYVDPEYDFITDRHASSRERYWTDAYAHELMSPPPYDGLLVSMSAIRQANGVANSKVRYSTKEEQRFLRDGARKFLRFDGPQFQDLMLMGDCGAFAYVQHPKPAYSPTEVLDFYVDAGFTHGVSPDHIIFSCDLKNPSATNMSREILERYEITLENAKTFIELVRKAGSPFEPLGSVQGWSPKSMAEAAKQLEKMGYRYLAVGGLVPLKVDAIKAVLQEIRDAVSNSTNLHLLGFAKADQIDQFTSYGITSFDSTSPLIRAFKDRWANYYMESPSGGIEYYTAVRIPQALENPRLMQGIKRGIFKAEDLQHTEQRALSTFRSYDKGRATASEALKAIVEYQKLLEMTDGVLDEKAEKSLARMQNALERTILEMPWKRCKCNICLTVGVEVIIFRASNRNKRRGFHNLGVYHRHLHRALEGNK